ncbi:TonB-dependent receptor [Burkholderia sp. FERM BP-3421]|uniref:TonB-dependent siderophore receptor n=1 Tax=Burkholderia sp. FERM BP-3421 TaxID=1494466 RepID=UPI002360CCDE|nr:TonB-dependent receptor [Burkholderia sp. FERM BP-3421]WDD92098.1 TonB-dependent receptor [Burkholderia sp. FERM BP-3421]
MRNTRWDKKIAFSITAGWLLGGCGLAIAQTVVVNVPAQSLSTALVALSHQGKVNILAPDALVANQKASAISGELTIREALDRMLNGTGLKAEQELNGTWVIVATLPRKPVAPTTGGAPAVLPTIVVRDRALSRDTGFVAHSTSTATRTDTPIGQIPQSIQVINQDALKSASVRSVTDALAYIGGVQVADQGGGIPNVLIRGYQVSTMSNGVGDISAKNSATLATPMAGLERIEVLKGADSILAGAMFPGGIVNIVSKQPTAIPTHELTIQAGSYGDWLGAVDLGGPLTQDRRLTYRFVLSTERVGQTFGGYDGGKTLYVAPSLGWTAGGTEIVIGYQHLSRDLPAVPETLVESSGPIALNGVRPTPLGNTLVQSDKLYANFKQQLGKYLQFESKTLYEASSMKTDHLYSLYSGDTLDATSFTGNSGLQRSWGFSTDNYIRARFSIGSVKQELLAGFNYSLSWADRNMSDMNMQAPFPAPSLPAITNPRYFYEGVKNYFKNFYLQDQLTWGNFHVLAGIAHGTTWQQGDNSEAAWSPNIGVLYQLTDSVAVYANALRSFVPQGGALLMGGGTAPPNKGRSVEAGFKFNFLDDRLSGTAAVFRTENTDVLQYVPGELFPRLIGDMIARGVELNATGRLLPGLNIIASYTYNNQLKVPMGASNIPRHSGSLWMTYDLQGERWQGWGVGGGIQARSGYQFTNAGVVYRLPGQMQTDLSIYYRTKRWSTTLAIKNLFDRQLYQNSAYGGVVGLEPGRLVYLTGRYNF